MRKLLTTGFGRLVVILMLALTMGLAVTPRAAVAGFLPTVNQSDQKSKDLATIRQALEIKKVSGTLAALGYEQAEIEARLAQLSDAEISSLAGQLEEAMTPSGSAVGIVIGVAVVALVVLGVLSLMGKRVVVSE
ncbi:MAG: PA2779 family protein [Deltaproteobacteria bacterium]|nr:PA2779 family protein [Deltaproteobacteria bacterium]